MLVPKISFGDFCQGDEIQVPATVELNQEREAERVIAIQLYSRRMTVGEGACELWTFIERHISRDEN